VDQSAAAGICARPPLGAA